MHQISLAAMCRNPKNSAIVRDHERDYVSLIIDPDADYKAVIQRGAKLLKVNPRECTLVHVSGGSRVSDSPIIEGTRTHPWTIFQWRRSI